MFTEEYHGNVEITAAYITEPKFAKGEDDFDIVIEARREDDPAQSGSWAGEVSDNYGKGNFATQMQSEITLSQLRKLGFEGDDLDALEDQLVGQVVAARIEAKESKGKTFYNLYFDNGPKRLDATEAKRRAAKLFASAGDAGDAPAAPPPPKQAMRTAGANPFAKKA